MSKKADIARLRGVSPETVRNNMADGRIFIGRQAVEANLVDGIATRESVLGGMAIGGPIALAGALGATERRLRLVKSKGTDAAGFVDGEAAATVADLAGLASARLPVQKPDFETLVAAYMQEKSCSKGIAIQAVAKAHPEEHTAFIEKVNAGG